MGKALKSLIGWLCFLIIATGVALALIPTTREQIADWAMRFSPKHTQTIEQNKKQAEEITSLKEEVKTKQNTIAEKDSLIATKDSQLKEKNTAIANYETQLDTCKNNIETLSTQKVLLCNSLTEIDNKINSTTDSVELENLETKKSAILNQIDTLNSEIATLTEQKTQLETDIATLQQEKITLQNEIAQLKVEKANLQKEVADLQERLKLSEETAGVEYLYDYYDGYFFDNVRSTKLDNWVYRDINKSYFASFLTNNGFGIFKKTRAKVKYSNSTSYAEFNVGYYDMNLSDIQWSIDDESKTVDEIRAFVNESTNDYIGIYSYLSISADNGSQVTLKVNIQTTRLLTGIYYKNDGTFIDFDNPENTTTSFSSLYWRIGANTDYESYIVLGGWLTAFEQYDDYILIDGNIKLTRNAPTPTAEQIYVTVNGRIDTEQYLNLTFDKGVGTFKITNSSDGSIVQECSIEFVSFNVVNKILTFKDASTDSQFVFTDTVFALSEDGNTYVITGANYNNNLTN